MALDANTLAATNITSSSGRLQGEWTQDNSSCCDAPPCSYAQRFYHGTSDPPGTLLSAGSICGADLCDGGANPYNKNLTGLPADTTRFFQASIATASLGGSCDPSCGGGCGGSNNSTVLSFKTCAEDATFGTVSAGTPGETTVDVQCTLVNPKVLTSTATVLGQYKLQTEPTVWTTGGSRAANRNSALTEAFTFTGLVAATAYDFRFRVERVGIACGTANFNSAQGVFTTAASSIALDIALETTIPVDAVTLAITGQAVQEVRVLGINESLDLELITTNEETFVGVWFYHLPTRSYWFWNFDNFTAAINDTDANDKSRLFLSLGPDVYIADDEEYFFDDRDQRHPLEDTKGKEIELSIVPRTVDLGGGYGRVAGVEVKWGAPPTLPDPTGNVDIGLLTDTYPKRPTPPDTRRVLAERRVPIAPDQGGFDEWRRYSVPRVPPSNVAGVRFSFPTGTTPKRVAPIEIESVRLNLTRSSRRRRRV